MQGAVFGGLGVLAILAILVLGLSPLFIVPIVVVVGAAVFMGVAAAAGRAVGGDVGEGSGVPATGDAAYDPTRETAERPL